MRGIYSSRINLVLGAFILVVVILFTLGTYYNHDIIGGMFALELSDTMYLPTLYKDLVIDGGNYSDWYLTPAPYFFPDIFLYFIASLFTGYFYHSNIVFILFQLLLLFLFLYILYKSVYRQGLACLIAAVVTAIFYMVPTSISTLLIKGGWHYGVTLSGVMVLSAIVSVLCTNRLSKVNGVFIFIVSALIVASDKLFVVQFSGPMVFALVTLKIFYKLEMKIFLKLLIIIFSSILTGYLIAKLLIVNQTAYPISYSLSHVFENYPILASKFIKYFQSNYVFVSFNLLIVIYLFFNSILTFFGKSSHQSLMMNFCSVFYAAMTFLIIAILLLSDLEMANRYLIPIFMLPVMILPLIIGENLNKRGFPLNKVYFYLGVLSLIISIGWSLNKLSGFKYKDDYYPNYIQCIDHFLDDKNVKYGIGNYWVSKRFSMLNKTGYKVVNVSPNLKPIHRISTAGWDQEVYDFVIYNKRWNNNPKLSKILSRNDNPRFSKTSCGFIEIYYFADGVKLK